VLTPAAAAVNAVGAAILATVAHAAVAAAADAAAETDLAAAARAGTTCVAAPQPPISPSHSPLPLYERTGPSLS